jgi:hypothetical protein
MKMNRNFSLIIVFTVAITSNSYLISQNKVESIRAMGAKWEVHDPETNPLRNYTTDQLLKMVSLQ